MYVYFTFDLVTWDLYGAHDCYANSSHMSIWDEKWMRVFGLNSVDIFQDTDLSHTHAHRIYAQKQSYTSYQPLWTFPANSRMVINKMTL